MIKEAVGLCITTNFNGNAEINACGINIIQNKLNFVKKLTGVQSLVELSTHFPPKTIIALNLSGKGILQKQIEKIEGINPNNFSSILPNAEFDDFYIQNFISGNKSFVSVIRKTEVDKRINELQQLDFIVLSVSLGPFAIENIISQTNIYETEIVFNGHQISRDESLAWLNYYYDEALSSKNPLKIESENISEKLLIAYAVAFQLVLSNKLTPIIANVPQIESRYHDFINNRKLKTQGFLILACFFVLLLGNFFTFSYLTGANNKLTEQVSKSAQNNTDIQKINEQTLKKEALLKNLGYEGAFDKSILVDQLASLLPDDLTLKEVSINPIDLNTSRNQKTISFYSKRIKIVGNSDKIIPVNEWIARIKTKNWVRNIQLESFIINNELNTGQFTILIDY
jgi:Tfp pilus assembly protein PilN